MRLLNALFSSFDDLVAARGLEKIKTIGDSYMAAGGLPEPLDGHASRIVELGLAMIDEAARHGGALGPINLRIGVHSGRAVGGVIGKRKIAFDVWGDTVNVASRLEEQGVAGRIQISEATRLLLGEEFEWESRGSIDLKGHGSMATFLIIGPRRMAHRRRRIAGVAQRDRRIAVDSLAPMNPSRLLAPVRDVLGNGPMARVQAAWLLSIAAEWAYLVALLVFAYGVGGVAAAGLIATLRMLPPVIGAPLATTLADRFPTPAVLAGVNAMRALVVLSTAAVLVLDGPPALVFVAAMVEGLFAVVKRPATLSLLPGLARTPEELVAGNAVMSSGEALGMLVGPAAASLVLGLGGLEVALAVPAIALLAAAALTVTLRAATHRARRARRNAARARRWLPRAAPALHGGPRRRASSRRRRSFAGSSRCSSSRRRSSCSGSGRAVSDG